MCFIILNDLYMAHHNSSGICRQLNIHHLYGTFNFSTQCICMGTGCVLVYRFLSFSWKGTYDHVYLVVFQMQDIALVWFFENKKFFKCKPYFFTFKVTVQIKKLCSCPGTHILQWPHWLVLCSNLELFTVICRSWCKNYSYAHTQWESPAKSTYLQSSY